MGSFVDVINNIATTLQQDAALSSFCQSKWGRSLSVKKIFKERTEIGLNDLPSILITRPSTEKSFRILGFNIRDWSNTVRLYCGFHQQDKLKALEELIEFEEKIDDALLFDSTRGGLALRTDPKTSVNDEGIYYPTYFLAMDVEIISRR